MPSQHNETLKIQSTELPWYFNLMVATPLIFTGLSLAVLGILLPFLLPISLNLGLIFLAAGVLSAFATMTYGLTCLLTRENHHLQDVTDNQESVKLLQDNDEVEVNPLTNSSSIISTPPTEVTKSYQGWNHNHYQRAPSNEAGAALKTTHRS